MSHKDAQKAQKQKVSPQSPAATTAEVLRWNGKAALKPRTDLVAVEEPLEIRVAGHSVAVTMRTPGHDRELAAGFLLTEGIIRERRDVVEIIHCRATAAPDNTLNVFLSPSVKLDFAQLTRHVFATSSCGLCVSRLYENVPMRTR